MAEPEPRFPAAQYQVLNSGALSKVQYHTLNCVWLILAIGGLTDDLIFWCLLTNLGALFISESFHNQSLESYLSGSVINRKLVFDKIFLALCGFFVPKLPSKRRAAVAHRLLISCFQESSSCADLQISRGFPAVCLGGGGTHEK